MLNEKGYKTKRNCKWSQNATCRILTNEIYTGKIINGKQEVSDFLTGQRRDNTFKEIEDITDVHQMTNQQLKRLIQKIEVDKEGNVDIYLRLLGDLGLDESVLIEENETVLNCDDQT